MMHSVTVSIVTFKTPEFTLRKAVESILSSAIRPKVYIVDNSPNRCEYNFLGHPDIEYIYTGKNLGFGTAHNLVLLDPSKTGRYHLILNPDVYWDSQVLSKLKEFMDFNKKAGLVMPRICYPDGSLQYLCKLLPSPIDLFARRFLPSGLFKGAKEKFEMRFTGYNRVMSVPYLSGCFMFLRSEIVQKIGGFDENIFMYGEDLDLTRRMLAVSDCVFNPAVTVYHEHQKESYKSIKMLLIHLKAITYYFNKWGWFVDSEKKKINYKMINQLGVKEL